MGQAAGDQGEQQRAEPRRGPEARRPGKGCGGAGAAGVESVEGEIVLQSMPGRDGQKQQGDRGMVGECVPIDEEEADAAQCQGDDRGGPAAAPRQESRGRGRLEVQPGEEALGSKDRGSQQVAIAQGQNEAVMEGFTQAGIRKPRRRCRPIGADESQAQDPVADRTRLQKSRARPSPDQGGLPSSRRSSSRAIPSSSAPPLSQPRRGIGGGPTGPEKAISRPRFIPA